MILAHGLEFEDFKKFCIVAEACKQQRKKENELNDRILCNSSRLLLLFVQPVGTVLASSDTAYFFPLLVMSHLC
jgi:hypothetical protein